jgi:glutamate dehydrogenase
VEGANLFITQQARLALERRGVILYKDASANKGGVTRWVSATLDWHGLNRLDSSSLEVLAGLALTDEQFLDLMATENEEEGVSDFYADYVQDIQRIISVNAASEFQCIWDEAIASGKPRSTLTDEVGQTLIKLQDQLETSDLFDNESARKTVLAQALPKTLVKQFGLDTILSRLPETYMRSLFASYLASRA